MAYIANRFALRRLFVDTWPTGLLRAKRLSVLLESARERLAGLLEISSVEAGLQTVGWLSKGIDGESAARAATKRDVEVIPLSCYSRQRLAREGLQLGFAAVDAREIRRGVKDLAAALEEESKALQRRGRQGEATVIAAKHT